MLRGVGPGVLAAKRNHGTQDQRILGLVHLDLELSGTVDPEATPGVGGKSDAAGFAHVHVLHVLQAWHPVANCQYDQVAEEEARGSS